MTSGEMMKKIALRAGKPGDGENNGKLKNQIFNYLKEGKNTILALERKIRGEKNVKGILDKVRWSKKRLQAAKRNFDRIEQKAGEYIEKNPRKAVAMAAAAGVLAGRLWSAFKRGGKPGLKKKS